MQQLLIFLVFSIFGVPVISFSPSRYLPVKIHQSTGTSRLLASEADGATEDFSPLTRGEVEELLDNIPVYAITETNKEGLVLLKDKESPKELAYFFFSPDTANAVFSPLRQKNPDAAWDVKLYPLGQVWFELFGESKEQGVEFRLVPEGNDLAAARSLLEQQSKQSGLPVPELFKSGYNEIPVFIDQFLRIQADDGEEKFPMYLGYQDMVMTLQQAAASTDGAYEAALSVVDLASLMDQMMQTQPENDFRKVMLVRPSFSQPATGTTPEPVPDQDADEEEFRTPMATETWED